MAKIKVVTGMRTPFIKKASSVNENEQKRKYSRVRAVFEMDEPEKNDVNDSETFGSVINKINKHIDSVVLLCKDAGKLAGDDKKRIKELTALNEAVEKFKKNIK